jgi:hypothetical protein
LQESLKNKDFVIGAAAAKCSRSFAFFIPNWPGIEYFVATFSAGKTRLD